MTFSPNSACRGKRPRIHQEEVEEEIVHPEEEPFNKIPRRPGQAKNRDTGVFDRTRSELPLAPKLADYIGAGGHSRYRPRPEWYQWHHQNVEVQREAAPTSAPIVEVATSIGNGSFFEAPADGLLPEGSFQDYLPVRRTSNHRTTNSDAAGDHTRKIGKPATFGKDWDHAIHVAIRENATESVIELLDLGVPLEVANAKRFTPLILAAQKGNLFLVRELLRRGANTSATTITGVSAVLQAAHFGRCDVLRLLLQAGSPKLIEQYNYNQTTPLMRASQEGHVQCVRLLLEAGAQVNRRNRAHLTALMLASQRGHAEVCKLLIEYGAELDAMTHQSSTSLLLACKRGNLGVVRVLVTAGCELSGKDSRGRTVRDIALRRDQKEMVDLLDPSVQIDMMQREGRRLRSFEMIRMWHLLQKERANILVPDQPTFSIYEISSLLNQKYLPYTYKVRSTTALLRTMSLPEPLVQTIAEFLPLPHLWERRIGMLFNRSSVNADDSVSGALDLVDEILEEGGFLEACDKAGVPPPLLRDFRSWEEWKAWGRRYGKVEASDIVDYRGPPRIDLTTSCTPPPRNLDRPCLVEWRRHAGFLQLLATHRLPQLARILASPPYRMPPSLIEKCIQVSDVASLTRRMRSLGVHFDVAIAMDLIMLVSQLCAWYWRERDEVVYEQHNI